LISWAGLPIFSFMEISKLPPLESVRLDRWLMAARFYKTRSQAADACNGGKVKVDGDSAKPHKLVRPGDKLTIHHHDRYREIEVVLLAERGLPPKIARELYKEEIRQTLSVEAEELLRLFRQSQKKPKIKYKGRPTKKTRRELDRWKIK
jgi:ribosome-associated heat shock protein Hsp15